MDRYEEFLTRVPGMIGAKEGAINPPVVGSAAFAYGTPEQAEAIFAGEAAAPLYARVGNPTSGKLESLLAEMDGGIAAVATSSGMAATTLAILSLCDAGDEIIAVGGLFGGSYSLFAETLSRYGMTARFMETDDIAGIRAAVGERTKVIFCESVGNPNMKLPDLAAIGRLAAESGVALIVDNTVTPLAVRPLDLGADMVVYSTTKLIAGNASALGGAVVMRGLRPTGDKFGSSRFAVLAPFIAKAGARALVMAGRKRVMRDFGMSPNAFASYMTMTGFETLPLRTQRINASVERLARRLSDAGAAVRHPSLPEHEHHARYSSDFPYGCGPLLTIDLGDKEEAFRFLALLRRATLTANIGDSRTLALHMASTIYRDFDEDVRRYLGITPGLVRLSMGLENPDMIADDMIAALR